MSVMRILEDHHTRS